MNGGSTSTLSLSRLQQGTYTFRFRVKDSQNISVSDDVTIVVKAASGTTTGETPDTGEGSADGNLIPLVKASNDKILTLPENATLLTCAGKDEDGFIVSYKWVKMSGPTAGTASGSFC